MGSLLNLKIEFGFQKTYTLTTVNAPFQILIAPYNFFLPSF
jgi:hypothetical protein